MNIRRTSSYAAAALLPVLVALMALPDPQPQQQLDPTAGHALAAPSFCANKIKFEPVVTYDVSGSTFAGPFGDGTVSSVSILAAETSSPRTRPSKHTVVPAFLRWSIISPRPLTPRDFSCACQVFLNTSSALSTS